MGLNDVNIIEGQGGLGRPLPGQDYISGFPFFSDVLPSGFTTQNNIKQILSLGQAESLGILNDYSDATAARALYTVTAIGANGDTITLKTQEPVNLVTLGSYIKAASETTTALVAAAIAAAINAGTITHGYTATVSTNVVTIIAPKKWGIFLNTGAPLSAVIVGTITGTIAQYGSGGGAVAGVASLLAVWHYHISEYFRLNPLGNTYVGFFPVTAQTWNLAELVTMQNFSSGIIRQFGVYLANNSYWNSAAKILTAANAIQAQLATLKTAHKPSISVFATDITAISDLTTLSDLSTLSDANVSTTIGQDGANQGFLLWKATGYTISDLGAVLGAISFAKVSEDIAYVKKFNLTDGLELSVPAFGNGVLFLNAATNLLTQLNNYRYIFLRTFTGVSGTFVNDSHSCVAQSSSYAYIENNRTAQKAERLLYAFIIPELNGQLQLNANGTLADTTIAYLTSVGNTALDQMVRDQEISAYKLLIDSTQNVLATNTLAITAQIVQEGVARNITVTLQYVNSIS